MLSAPIPPPEGAVPQTRSSIRHPHALSALGMSRRLRELVPGLGRRLLLIAAPSFAAALAEAVLLVALARLAVSASRDTSSVDLLGGWHVSTAVALTGVGVLLVTRVVLGAFSARLTASAAADALTKARFALLRSFFNAPWHLQASDELGDMQELLTTHVDRTASAVLTLASFTTSALALLTLVTTSILVNPLAAVVIASLGAVLSALLRPVAGYARQNAASQSEAGRRFASAVNESVGLAREVRTFGVAEAVLDQLAAVNQIQARRYSRSRFLLLLSPQLYQGAAFAFILGSVALLRLGDANLNGIGPVVLLLLRGMSYGQAAQSARHALNDLVPYLEDLLRQQAKYSHAASPPGEPVPSVETIGFDGLSFEYTPGRPVLRDVSFTIRQGELIGLTGPSGSGKSTLVRLLLRLFEPSAGRLEVNGHDAGVLDMQMWCEAVSLVPQDPKLLTGTIRENIAFFRPFTLAQVEEAGVLACVHDEILELPNGYGEVLGPGVSQLSGGQQQRVCIARALIGGPHVLLLDEPTSALDARSEAGIRETLLSLRGKVTVVVVTHRPSTLSMCDRVLVLADGRIQAFDTPDQLLASSSFYADVLRLSGISPRDRRIEP